MLFLFTFSHLSNAIVFSSRLNGGQSSGSGAASLPCLFPRPLGLFYYDFEIVIINTLHLCCREQEMFSATS